MFMRCGKCGNEADERWKFCPRCGSALEKAGETGRGRDLFEDAFGRMEREMREMDKAFRPFERNFEVIDLSPFFAKPAKGSGFSIKITRSGDGKPKVDVRTFGDVNRKEVENEVSKLGFRDRIGRALKPVSGEAEPKPKGVRIDSARTTEEPETTVKNTGGGIIAEVKLPGVRRAEDIEVKPLENSIEIKAIAGDKAYFKILTKPHGTSVARQEFSKGVLTIELH
jgi:HSP20 family molecular chaperone IbpA